jgi:hypothetical protein
MTPRYTDDELRSAIERLSDREAFAEAETVVSKVAPELQAVLVEALRGAGWFGESHQSETLKAATIPDEDARLEAVRSLLTEETHIGMMVGVAVGWALRAELGESEKSPEEEQK